MEFDSLEDFAERLVMLVGWFLPRCCVQCCPALVADFDRGSTVVMISLRADAVGAVDALGSVRNPCGR